ncbi:MAG: glycoside hydrolase family 38 C-terminal domain-containing protein [Terracidiphilus sp.]|jgi:alpha-mannosidase
MNFPSKSHLACLVCVAAFIGTALLAGRAAAQSTAEAAKIAAVLPSDAQAVIDRLSSLHELPDGTWKMQAGDVPHGEAVNLDESKWQPISKGTAPKDAVWFRQAFEVPATLSGYDLTGARIWFQFHAEANGPMPEILYFDGRRVAMGEDLEPVVLFDHAKPGDIVTVAIKLLHTVDDKHINGATLKIDFPEGRPNPEDLRKEFLSAALLVPTLAPNDPSRLATLSDAIRAVDLSALTQHDQAKFDASLTAAHAKLDALTPLLRQVTFHLTGNSHIDAAWLWPWTETVDVVRHTFGTALQLMYEYPEYTYTQSAAAYNEWMANKYPAMNAEIQKRIDEGRWEIVGGMWVEPDLNMPDGESLVRQLLVGKRWYMQAYNVDVRIGWNPDSFGYTWQLPQIYKKSGIDYFVTQKMTWNDTNKLPFKVFWWESPDGSKVLTYFPHDYGNQDLSPVRLSRDFTIAQRQAPGLPSMMDLYGIGDHGGGPTRAVLDEGMHWITPGHVTPKYEFGTAQSYFTALEIKIAPDSTVWDYASIAKGYTPPPAVPGKVSIPTWKSELYLEYHRGVFTTQANHKRNMREAEEEMLNAEKWASLAWLDGKSYPAVELTEDWKKVLFNQFHDLAAGSGIGVIYKDAQKDYDVVRLSTDEIARTSLQTVTENIDTQGEGTPVVVFNPLGWTRTGTVRIKAQVPYQEGYHFRIVPPRATGPITYPSRVTWDKQTGVAEMDADVEVQGLGYAVYHLVLEADNTGHNRDFALIPQSFESESFIRIRNSKLQLTVDKSTGCITSLQMRWNQGSGEPKKWATVEEGVPPARPSEVTIETVPKDGCANELQAFNDTPKDYDAWNIDPGTLDQPPTLLTHADKVELVGGDTRSPGVRVTRTWQHSKFVQTISLRTGADQVDVENDIDWHETHVLLKAAFPLTVSSDHATYEIPYGTIDRPTTRNNSWEKAQFEVAAMRWADLSGKGEGARVYGLSVINESKYGYDATESLLRLTLLRSPVWPDPEADRGHHHFHYALYPHMGTWKEAQAVRHGWEYNYPLTSVTTTAHPGLTPAVFSFASVAPESLVLTAMKKAEDSNALILRAYEWAGKATTARFHVPPGAVSATVTNLMEATGASESGALEVAGDVVKAPIKPYEILTIRVDYPNGGVSK